MPKMQTVVSHRLCGIGIQKAAFLVALTALIIHTVLLSMQICRSQYLSSLGHGISIACYILVLVALQIIAPKWVIPYFLFHPASLLLQILIEIHAHYAHYWKRKNYRFYRAEYLKDLTLLLCIVGLIVLTHCLITSIIYQTFCFLKYQLMEERKVDNEMETFEPLTDNDDTLNDFNGSSISVRQDNVVRCNGGVKFV
ncbi:hypothetical protein M3Y96_00390700 [Aphelenchoides besseyi]|nr:hypothetical protein M3Y96_00390700 [Aphelenchoides besseyi]